MDGYIYITHLGADCFRALRLPERLFGGVEGARLPLARLVDCCVGV